MSYENLILNNDGSYTFDKNGMPYNCPSFGEWVEEFAQVDAWAKDNPSKVGTPKPVVLPTIAEMAATMAMSKDDFLRIAIAFTANFPLEQRVTLAKVKEFVAQEEQLEIMFNYANEVKRNNPLLDVITAEWDASFVQYLDYMFVFRNEILAMIDSGQAIDLDVLLQQTT